MLRNRKKLRLNHLEKGVVIILSLLLVLTLLLPLPTTVKAEINQLSEVVIDGGNYPLTTEGLKTAIANTESNGKVYIKGNISITEMITISKSITIDGNAISTLTRDSSYLGQLLKIDANVTAKIERLTIDGASVSSVGELVNISASTSKLTIGAKTSLINNKNSAITNTGSLTLNGGYITKNSSTNGAIYNLNGATITMNGGEISENVNTGTYSAGIINKGTLNINGGTFSKNITSGNGGAIYNDGTLNISNGQIISNQAKIGGGVYNENKTFNFSGGNIEANNATEKGGGVYQKGTNFTVSKTAAVVRNVVGGTFEDVTYATGITVPYMLTGGKASNVHIASLTTYGSKIDVDQTSAFTGAIGVTYELRGPLSNDTVSDPIVTSNYSNRLENILYKYIFVDNLMYDDTHYYDFAKNSYNQYGIKDIKNSYNSDNNLVYIVKDSATAFEALNYAFLNADSYPGTPSLKGKKYIDIQCDQTLSNEFSFKFGDTPSENSRMTVFSSNGKKIIRGSSSGCFNPSNYTNFSVIMRDIVFDGDSGRLGNSTNPFIKVDSTNLYLQNNFVLTKCGLSSNDSSTIRSVSNSSKIYLQGASIINNYIANEKAYSGIQVQGNLFVSGALIAGNNDAIYMKSDGSRTTTINGGMIVGNYSYKKLAGIIQVEGTSPKIIMNSGIISYNHSDNENCVISNGRAIDASIVELNGGLISHNKKLIENTGTYFVALNANNGLTIKGWISVKDNFVKDKEFNILFTNSYTKAAKLGGSLYGEVGISFVTNNGVEYDYFPQYLFAKTDAYTPTIEDIKYLTFDQTGHNLNITMTENNDGIKSIYPIPIISEVQQPTTFIAGETIKSKISNPTIEYYNQNNISQKNWKIKKDVDGALYENISETYSLSMDYNNASLKYSISYGDGVDGIYGSDKMLLETNIVELSVIKATPVLKLEITPTMSGDVIDKLTLRPVLQGGYNPSGNIQIKVDGTDYGSKLASGATLDFEPTERDKEYTFKAAYAGDKNNNDVTSIEYKFTFNKKIQSILTLEGSNKAKVEDSYSINVTGGSTSGNMSYQLIHGTTGEATIQNNVLTITRAGEIQFSVTMEGDSTYNPITQLFSIEAIDKSISVITFKSDEKTVSYSGEKIEFTDDDVNVTGTDGAVSYKYYTNDSGTLTSTSDSSGATTAGGAPKNAGTYYVKASVAGNEEYSSATTEKYAKLVINKVTLTPTIKTITSKDYDGYKNATGTLNFTGAVKNEQPVASATFEWVSKNALTTNVTVTGIALTTPWQQNYSLSTTSLSSQVAPNSSKINKKDLTVNVVIKDKQYDGLNTAEFKTQPTLNGVISGENVLLVNGTPTFNNIQVANDIDIHLTNFSINGSDKENYNLTQPNGIKASITNTYNPTIDVDYTMPISEWLNEDIIITAKSGYKLSYTNTVDGIWSDTLTLSTETNDGTVEFYVKNTATKAISTKVTKNYKLDKTAPQGTIEVGDSSWNQFLNTITFGLFFKETQQVTINATDDLSDISKVEYYESRTQKTLEELKAVIWTSGKQVSITPEDEKAFIYYARITDKAGNVTYISSDGMVFDTTAPIIKNLNSETVYYINQPLEIEETNLKSVSINGTVVTLPYTLPGNINKTYTIIAIDKAGNQTTLTITMKQIQELGKVIDDITMANVNSTHIDRLEKLIQDINQYLLDQNLSEGDKTEFNNLKNKTNNLLNEAKKIADASQPDSYKEVAEVTQDNVQLSSKNKLEEAKAELLQALTDYSNHYTDAEKQDIQNRINIIEDSLKIIRVTNNVKQQIDQLPSQSNTTLQDGQKIIKSYDDYFLLTDHAKSLIVNDDKVKLFEVATSYAELNLIDDNTNTAIKATEGTYFNPHLALVVEKEKPVEEKVESVKKASQGSSIVSLFDINLLLGEEKVQPSGYIKIRLKLTEDQILNYTNYQVVYIDDNNTTTIIPHVREGDYVIFETDHLSQYGIIGKEKIIIEDNKDVEDNKTTSNDIKTGDHSPMLISTILLAMSVSIIIYFKKKRLH